MANHLQTKNMVDLYLFIRRRLDEDWLQYCGFSSLSDLMAPTNYLAVVSFIILVF
jgi:hypothetical protein